MKYERRSCPALKNQLNVNHAGMLSRDPRLAKPFPDPPKPVFARHRNLKEFLTRGKLPPLRHATRHSTQTTRNGTTRCNKGTGRQGCAICPFITDRPSEVVKEVHFASSGLTEQVEGKLTCKQGGEGGFLYVVQETKSKGTYLGESGQPQPATRGGQHRRTVQNMDDTKAVGKYFEEKRADTDTMRFIPFIAVKSKNPFVRKFLERKLIIKHKLVESPLGMNLNI